MSYVLTPEQSARVDRIVANGIHELYRTHPEVLNVNSNLVVAIFTAGVRAAVAALRELPK